MKWVISGLGALLFAVCATQTYGQDFSWPKDRDVISDEHTAIMVSVAYYEGIIHQQFDPTELATHLQAYRYRSSDLARDPKGDAWFVKPSDKDESDFKKACGAGNCIGGILYTMDLSAHDGRILAFYLPQ